jgi:hypothetical protein
MSYRNLCDWRDRPTSLDISSWLTGSAFLTNLVESIGKIKVNAEERAKKSTNRSEKSLQAKSEGPRGSSGGSELGANPQRQDVLIKGGPRDR